MGVPHWLALALATLVSEDLTTIAAGILVGRNEMRTAAAVLGCASGIYVGDLLLWMLGRFVGARALRHPRVAGVIPPGGPDRLRRWIDGHPVAAIVASRFTPGMRLPLYVAAGACRTSLSTFACWSLAATAVWTPLLIALSAILGDQVGRWIVTGKVAIVTSTAIGFGGWRLVVALTSNRRRQRLAAAVSRLWRWEFWPMWLFYLPVIAWTAYLAVRHGGYRTLTAANPGMPDGGVVGESKFAILTRLPAEYAVPAALIAPGPLASRLASFSETVATTGWTYPLILKPDVGQRGTGVRLVGSGEAAASYLQAMTAAVVVQPYHPGPYEAGVFYFRRPGCSRGRILCVTDKHFPVVSGDGRSTLEDLIWAHPRYRMQARTFLSRLGVRRNEVPAAGQPTVLGIAGNHAQGAMFTDGAHLITASLEARIDAIAQAYDGFFIGRFDVRYGDRERFMAGEDLAIVELNGATSECTNIYDPNGTLLAAYRQLFRQWQLVFEIGAANRRHGRRVTSANRLRGLVRAHLSTNPPLPVSD